MLIRAEGVARFNALAVQPRGSGLELTKGPAYFIMGELAYKEKKFEIKSYLCEYYLSLPISWNLNLMFFLVTTNLCFNNNTLIG